MKHVSSKFHIFIKNAHIFDIQIRWAMGIQQRIRRTQYVLHHVSLGIPWREV